MRRMTGEEHPSAVQLRIEEVPVFVGSMPGSAGADLCHSQLEVPLSLVSAMLDLGQCNLTVHR